MIHGLDCVFQHDADDLGYKELDLPRLAGREALGKFYPGVCQARNKENECDVRIARDKLPFGESESLVN